MDGFASWDEESARALIGAHAAEPGAMLPILHALQERFGHVPAAAVPAIAEALNLSRAEVHGTISFYTDFRRAPPPARVIRLCRAEACQAVGCEALVRAAAALGVRVDDPAPAAAVAIESVYCLGNCALGPAALVDGALIGRLDQAGLAALCAGGPAEAQQRLAEGT